MALLVAALACACSSEQPSTEVLVVVDNHVRSVELSALRLRVFDEDGEQELADRELKLIGQSRSFPLSYSLTPGELGDNARFKLVVTGRGGEGAETVDLVEAQSVGAFRAGSRTRLDILLEESCVRELCRGLEETPGALSCSAGTCTDVPTAELTPAESGALGGYVARRDGGPARNDAGADVSRSDAAAPECERDEECSALLGALTPEGCAIASCEDGRCSFRARDADGDGHGSNRCTSDQVEVAQGEDCDDRDPRRSPAAWDGPAVPDEHPDSCDEIDNDCDGEPDDERPNGRTCECDPVTDVDVPCSQRADGTVIEWPAGSPVGVCGYGKRSCMRDGTWGACTGAIEPRGKDSCDIPNDDSDCDGERNEDCPCVTGAEQACGTDVGNCRAGVQTCNAGKWGACTGQIAAKSKDSCEPNDDADCDGTPNEGCRCVNGDTATCAEAVGSLGVCATRTVRCVDGAWDAKGCLPTAIETCADDDRDEDCDGDVNESPECECTDGVSVLCSSEGALGTCGWGLIPCHDGKLGSCDTLPAAHDTCSLFNDDNCDGEFNGGCACFDGQFESCSVGECTGGSRTCDVNGVWSECSGATDCPVPDGG